jgi:CMP-N-acetylneuraminic acid synthetase
VLKKTLSCKKKIVALIPARKGSERIKNKNILRLLSHPLIGYAINSAKNSKIFDKIVLSTDSKEYAKIAKYYGAEIYGLRPKSISQYNSPDYQWVKYTLNKLKEKNLNFTHFFILRPTNPFRTSKMIIKGWKKFLKYKKAESLRAVELSKNHPGKMWLNRKNYIIPFKKKKIKNQPLHNLQFASLPKVYIQNGSLEISRVEVVDKYKTITGKKIIPYFTSDNEGFDINYPENISQAKFMIKINKKILEKINKKPY